MLKLKGLSAEALNGFLDDGTEFSGELRFRDVLRVDGRLKGRVGSDNMLIIGETGQVDAEIDCGIVSIRGQGTRQVHGRQRIELLAGSRVLATLVTPKLVIEDGAFFQGDCRMGEGAAVPREGAAASRATPPGLGTSGGGGRRGARALQARRRPPPNQKYFFIHGGGGAPRPPPGACERRAPADPEAH